MTGPLRELLPPVAAGGALGALARYAVGVVLPTGEGLPVGTLLVNLTGCLALGVLVARSDSVRLRAFAGTGVLGGFTTFSAFALETDRLLTDRPGLALLYAGLSVVGGLAAVAVGRRASR